MADILETVIYYTTLVFQVLLESILLENQTDWIVSNYKSQLSRGSSKAKKYRSFVFHLQLG